MNFKNAACGIVFLTLCTMQTLQAAEDFLEPVYLVKVARTEVENRKILIGPNRIDAGLREIYLSVTGVFRSLEGNASEARVDDFVTTNDRFTRITNVFLRLSRGAFDDLVGRPEREQTIQFKVNGMTSKIAYLLAWPGDKAFGDLGHGEVSVESPQPMKYFRFEIDMKDPEKTPVKISQFDANPKK
jgi:hypothetical protein